MAVVAAAAATAAVAVHLVLVRGGGDGPAQTGYKVWPPIGPKPARRPAVLLATLPNASSLSSSSSSL